MEQPPLNNLKSKGTGSLEQVSKLYGNKHTWKTNLADKSICLETQKPAVSERRISFQTSRLAVIAGITSNQHIRTNPTSNCNHAWTSNILSIKRRIASAETKSMPFTKHNKTQQQTGYPQKQNSCSRTAPGEGTKHLGREPHPNGSHYQAIMRDHPHIITSRPNLHHNIV